MRVAYTIALRPQAGSEMNQVETQWFLAEGGCDGADIEIFVRGTVTPRVPATFDSPAEGGEVHIDAIEVSLPGCGRMVWSGELTEAERESVEEAMREAAIVTRGERERG